MENRLQQEEEFDFQDIIRKVKQYRWLFLVSVTICLLLTFLYNRYTIPVYSVKASILIDEEEDMSQTAELIYGTDLLSSNKSLYNEMAKLKSFPFIYRTVAALSHQVSCYRQGTLEDEELYNNAPIAVRMDTMQYNPDNEQMPFFVTILDDKTYRLTADWEKPGGHSLHLEKQMFFDSAFSVNGSKLKIKLQYLPEDYQQQSYYFVINNLHQLARDYKQRLAIYPYSKDASVIDISLETAIPQKEIDFLNEFTYQYSIVSLEDKNQSTSQSLNFIDEQLDRTYDTLQVIERTLENFKSRNSFSQASTMIERSFDKISELETEKAALLVNAKYYESLQGYMAENHALDQLVAPSAVGIQDILLNNLISELVASQIEMNTYLVEGSAKNPYVKELESKINNIKNTLSESLKNMQTSNQLRLDQLNQRIAGLEKEIGSLPEAERKYVNIKRLYDLNESVYNLLLQKKVEAGITQASATVDSKILEPAYLETNTPIKPRKTRNMIIALFIGLLLPAGFIFIRDKLSTKVASKQDINKFTDIPVIGTIINNEKALPLVVSQAPKSPAAESFRVLRSNLKFTAGGQPGNKIYLVTSTMSGEGKTFCSINLAIALALSGKKTLFLDADMRKNELIPGLDLSKKSLGLSNYLVNDATLDEIIYKSPITNLEVIPSGPMPPNPSELLMVESMELMMDVLKSSYEYIVIDTSPVGMVTDAQVLMRYTSANLYIVRQNFTEKEVLRQLEEMKAQKIINNVNLVYNDVKAGMIGYYGYGYYKPKKSKVNFKLF